MSEPEDCGCRATIRVWTGKNIIHYCRLHDSAPALLAALRPFLRGASQTYVGKGYVNRVTEKEYEAAIAAIAAATKAEVK